MRWALEAHLSKSTLLETNTLQSNTRGFGVLGFWGEVRLGCVRLWEGDTFFEFLDVLSVVCDRAILWVMGGRDYEVVADILFGLGTGVRLFRLKFEEGTPFICE